MIKPALSGDAFLADVFASRSPEVATTPGQAKPPAPPAPPFHLWWLGQSGFLVQYQGRHLLIDPYLSDSLTKKYAGTKTPHVRMTERVIAPERLDFIDVVTSSHNHTDHLDAETLGPLLRANPTIKLIIPEANRAFAAQRLAVDPSFPLGVDDGTSVEAAGFLLTGIRSAHEKLSNEYIGYVIQFGPWSIYHPGDTIRYPGMAERLRRYPIDVALLPINGQLGNLNGREAAALARDMGARLAIPCHYEMFEFNTASPAEFLAEAKRLAQPCRVLRCGERWSSDQL